MQFQGSAFAVTLPEGVQDASAYCFVLARQGSFPPNLTVRFERAADLDLEERVARALADFRRALPDLEVVGSIPVRSRGDWRYATQVIEWGDRALRIRQKVLYLWVPAPLPTLYVVSGTDLADNFAVSEPFFDEIIRSFQPNAVNLLR